jgi:hypothetical protein
MEKVSIIIPVVRQEKAARCVKYIYDNSGAPDVFEIVSGVDSEGVGCPEMVRTLVDQCQNDWIMFLGDDTLPQKDFLKSALEKAKELPDGWGMVGLNDGIHGDAFSTHWMCHRKMLDLTEGEFFHTGYEHQFCDKELTDIAKENGRFVFAEKALVKHDHPMVTGEPADEHYARVYDRKLHMRDRKLYLKRRTERTGQQYKVGIALPVTDDDVNFQFFVSFLQMDKSNCELLFPKFGFHKGDIAKVRNDLVEEALKLDCTHVAFLDTDQVYYDTDLIPRLVSHGKQITGGKVHRRWIPFEPILQRNGLHVPDEEIDKGGLVPVDSTGAGCLLINTDVFYEIEKPWFEVVRGENDDVKVGEDVSFCRKARKAGIEIFVDCDVSIGHLATIQVDDTLYQFWKKLRGEQQ